jgi:hypothetical protein
MRPRGRWATSARTHCRIRADASVSARTHLVLSQVTSKRTLQCVEVTDAPVAIVRSSVRPFENVRVTTLPDRGL